MEPERRQRGERGGGDGEEEQGEKRRRSSPRGDIEESEVEETERWSRVRRRGGGDRQGNFQVFYDTSRDRLIMRYGPSSSAGEPCLPNPGPRFP